MIRRTRPLGLVGDRGPATGGPVPLDTLTTALEAARGGRGSVAVVTAAPGLGKSVLLDTFGDRAEAQGVLTARAVADRAASGVSLGVVGNLLRGLGRAVAADPDADRQPGLAAVELLLDTARRQPLLLIVDDAQFVDPESARALLQLARRIGATRAMLLVARRDAPGGEAADFWSALLGAVHTSEVRLDLLGGPDVRRLLRARGPEAADTLADFLLTASGGSPLLLAGLLEDAREQPAPGPADDPGAGPGYRRAVRALLHSGGPELRTAAHGLAVLPEDCADQLEKLTGLAPGEGRPVLAVLARSGLWRDGRFAHPEARAAVLADLDPQARNPLFLKAVRLGQGLGRPDRELAAQVVQAGPPRPDWAVGLLESAAHEHAEDGDPDRAVELLALAGDLAADPAEADRLSVAQLRIRWAADPAVAARQIARLAAAPALTAADTLFLARAQTWLGQPQRARTLLARLDHGTGPADHQAAEEAEYTRDWLRATYPALADGPAVHDPEDAPALLRLQPSRRLDAVRALGAVLSGGSPQEAAEEAARLLGTARPTGGPDAAEAALLALTYAEHTELAAGHADALLAARPPGPATRARLLAVRAEIALRQGDLLAAETHARAALETLGAASWGIALGQPVAALVLALTATGRTGEAAALLDLPLPPAAAHSRYALPYLEARARLRTAQHDLPRAVADYQALRRLAADWRMDAPGLADWRNGLAEALVEGGERERARAVVEEQLARSGPESAPRAHGTALRLLAATEPPKRRAELLRRSAHVLRSRNHRYELAQALTDLTEAYADTGEARRARVVGRQGRALAEACGAVPLLTRLDRALDLPDRRRPGEDASTGLSRSEHRVAELAAMGDTNQEIAERLYVTVSTVEQHLTRAYRKLGVSGRTELATRLPGPGGPSAVRLPARDHP
ncbi:LuxR C-terminal-related transcriptional regulator [Kitasatospora phosalacinea]|uniref:LuxR C-terminal-related transcriptional regulator n=1 Tax=Kitasatospora phosalacinea TaxID=2065 RepID=UPI00364F3E72